MRLFFVHLALLFSLTACSLTKPCKQCHLTYPKTEAKTPLLKQHLKQHNHQHLAYCHHHYEKQKKHCHHH
ncbi:MAG: hypothetical protein ACWA5U_01430 [bacterium]